MLMKQVRMNSLNSISISRRVTGKKFGFLFNKFVPKIEALILRIFFSGECKILKLHSNEAAQIIVVEIQF
jgi:hypothetical protein